MILEIQLTDTTITALMSALYIYNGNRDYRTETKEEHELYEFSEYLYEILENYKETLDNSDLVRITEG